MITDMQQQLLGWFPDNEADGPEKVAPYGNEILNPRSINNLPALFVDVPSEFRITSADAFFELLDMQGLPELVLFASNKASGSETRAEIAGLIDWAVDKMQGGSITINGNTIPLQRIDGNIISDFDPKIALAVLKLHFTTHQDN